MKKLVGGHASGMILISEQPINFLGMVHKSTGIITDTAHQLYGISLADTILVFPSGIGSSVGAYTIYSTKSHQTAPAAMICHRADLTVASGCAISNIPLVIATTTETASLKTGMHATLDADMGTITVSDH